MTRRYEEGNPPIHLLFHGYRYGERSTTPDWLMAARNEAQLAAVGYLSRVGYQGEMLGKVVVAANWNQQGEPFSDRITDALIKEGIPESDIITLPKAKTTAGEVVVFLGLQESGGFSNGASLATEGHMPRVGRAHKKRGVREPRLIVAEDVLKLQLEQETNPRARALVDYFESRRSTWLFDRKEFVLRRTPEGLLEAMSGNKFIERIQESTDGK